MVNELNECIYTYKTKNDKEALKRALEIYMHEFENIVSVYDGKCEIEHDELLSIAVIGAIKNINKIIDINNNRYNYIYMSMWSGAHREIKYELNKRVKKEVSLDEYNSKHNNGEDKYYISDDILLKNLQIEKINNVIPTLKERERKILNLRFYEKLTLEEIGKIFDVTLERVRQIKEKSLRKLKRSEQLKDFQLKDFIEK